MATKKKADEGGREREIIQREKRRQKNLAKHHAPFRMLFFNFTRGAVAVRRIDGVGTRPSRRRA